MTNTERKLSEARYFLKQLNPKYVYFDYILSAFLNAARSTSWIMRHEFNKVDGWEKWFNSCKITKKERSLLKQINELRVRSTKKTGIKTNYFLADGLAVDEEFYPIVKQIFDEIEDGTEVTFTITEEDKNESVSPNNNEDSYKLRARVVRDSEENEFSRESIANLCKEYFVFLEKQVVNCASMFSITYLKK